jgi:hypothetical protein
LTSLQKVTNVVMKELEALARREIKEETAHLESLLSVLSTTDEVRPSYCRPTFSNPPPL